MKKKETWRVMDDLSKDVFKGASASARLESRLLLKQYGLRATRQRRGLAKPLFGKGDRHLTAETLAREAQAAGARMSLATVYNALNLFAKVGLIRSLAVGGGRAIFDTNATDHPHYFFEDTKEVQDIEPRRIKLVEDIETPAGYEVSRVDIVISLRRKGTDCNALAPCPEPQDEDPAAARLV